MAVTRSNERGGGPMRRDPLQVIGRTVADQASPHYRFERFVVAAADGGGRYRVNLAIPAPPPPAAGFPAFWMLDGNAALQAFDEQLLAGLARGTPQVLVFVGHDNPLRIDAAARMRDYTPLPARFEEDGGATRGGGADALMDVIAHRIRPELARRVPLDPWRQALWGHSLGGLFALHALYRGDAGFRTFAAASPSLWWAGGALLGAPERAFVERAGERQARVLLMLGEGERHPDFSGRDMDDPAVVAHLRRVAAVPADALEQLAGRLRQVPGLDVGYREFAGLGHGPMLRASLLHALHAVAGIADRSGEVPP